MKSQFYPNSFSTKEERKKRMHTLQVSVSFNRVGTTATTTQLKLKGDNQQVGIHKYQSIVLALERAR